MTKSKNRASNTPTTKKRRPNKETSPDDDDVGLVKIEPIVTEEQHQEEGDMMVNADAIIHYESPVSAMEKLLNYRFTNKSLIEEALTHPSFTESASYQRLEFIGDAALGLALANFVFISYPDLDPGQLSVLRAANISTEKLARVAIRNDLFSFVRHSAPALDQRVKEFAIAIQDEGDEVTPYGGTCVKAPKVLADIAESIAAAIYVDCNFDLKLMWEIFSPLLEPIATHDNLEPQPVTEMYELCQKHGKSVDFKNWRKGTINICNAFVDGRLLGSGFSEQRHIAKLNAAKEALEKLHVLEESLKLDPSPTTMELDGDIMIQVEEIDGAKQKLNEFCNRKRWGKPTYRVEKEVGPAHRKKFICSVHIETPSDIYATSGNIRARVKDAENAAASMMLYGLKADGAQTSK